MEYFKSPDNFSFDGPNVAQRWNRWQKQFETYYAACELSKRDKDTQVAILLHTAGAEAQEIHEQFKFEVDADKQDYKKILTKFEDYCHPRKNTVYERYCFWSRDQVEEEHVDKWVKDLRSIAKNCEFGDQEDNLIRDKLVFGVRDSRVKERMLRETDLTLKKAVEICRVAESTKSQMKEMCHNTPVKEEACINEVRTRGHSSRGAEKGITSYDKTHTRDSFRCYNCGGSGHYSRECPSGDSFPRGRRKPRGRGRGRARGQRHGNKNFYEVEEEKTESDYEAEFSSLSLNSIDVNGAVMDDSMCPEKDANNEVILCQDSEFSSLLLNTVTVNTIDATSEPRPTKRFVTFRFHKIHSRVVSGDKLKVDSGAEANMMPLRSYKKLYPENIGSDGMPKKGVVQRNNATLSAYGETVIKQIGTVTLNCEYKNKKFKCKFFLSDVSGPILLGLPTGEALGIIKIVDAIRKQNDYKTDGSGKMYVHPSTPLADRPPIKTKEDLKTMYPECFQDSNKYIPDYVYSIHLDPTAKPTVHAARRLPLELKPRVKRKLQHMESNGILAKVEQPTEWVNSMVVETKENGDLRICLDPKDLNDAILREHYPIPVLDEITPELAGSDTFTKLDAKDGYWHIRLDEKSSYMTTFNTPFGRYRYLRLPFGLKMAQDVFQMKIDEVYGPCEGAIGIADDITVHGKGEKEHDLRLHGAMERTRKSNISLNYDKIRVKQSSVKFFGNIYSANGVQADPDKVKAIESLRAPENRSELRTFLGMVNYLQQFIPKLSEHTAPLRELDKDSATFTWNETLQEVFENVKSLVSADVTLAYYDRTKPVEVQCDYSKQGLGATLVQEGRPIRYASKALVGPEKDYAPIEGEMLAVVFGIKKFHYYVYGRKFKVKSDHKPLTYIRTKNITLAPPRLRGMLMSIWQYDYQIEHVPGKELVMPDTLSRLSQADANEIPGLKVQINSLVEISNSRLEQLKQKTESDSTLKKLKTMVEIGWPSSIKKVDPEIRPYWSIRDGISVLEGLLLSGSRIIIPSECRKRTLSSIHEGHQGETKCLLRAKEAVYWPGMYKEIGNMVQQCSTCQEFQNAQPKCPMIAMEIPPEAWHTVGADLFHYKGRWHILVTDYYSKAPFVRQVANTGAAASIRAMKSIIAENGIPRKVVSDNGSHFSAHEFKKFADKYGFELILSSPEYPKGHGLIERHIQTVKKCMKKCDAGGYDFDLAMLTMRATPLDHNLPSPAELLNGRKYRTTLPSIAKYRRETSDVRQLLADKQRTATRYYNRTARAKPDLTPGQAVRLLNKDTGIWEPASVNRLAGTPRSYIVERRSGGRELRRNRVHLRATSEEDFPYCPDMEQALEDIPYGENQAATSKSQAAAPAAKATIPATPRTVFYPELQDTEDPLDCTLSSRPRRTRRRPDFYQAT